jgi:hypothetical protein
MRAKREEGVKGMRMRRTKTRMHGYNDDNNLPKWRRE